MAIFTKDGKVYVLEGPNPLVEKQISWERNKLIFHNFHWEDTLLAVAGPAKQPAVKKEKAPETTAEPRSETKQQEKDQSTHEEQPHQEKDERVEFELPHIKYKVLCHCLPAKVEFRSDKLYGESWTRVNYGSKFVFPCVVISASDISIEFWTSDPKQQITEKSIVYPFTYEVYNQSTGSYDRVPYDDYRWWKVSKKESKERGWLFTATPSDMQPDFSD